MTLIEILIVMLALLQVGDGYLTLAVFKKGGREANPVLLKLDVLIGRQASILVVKGVAIAVCCVFYITHMFEGAWYGLPTMVALNALYVWVVWHNYREWKK